MKRSSTLLVMALLGTLLTAMTATAAVPSIESAAKPLQFTSGGHVLAFTPRDVIVAAGSHALRVEFVGAQGVMPIAAGPAAPDGKAAPLTRVTYPSIWGGITLAYDAPGGLLRSTYTLAPGADPSKIRLRYNAPVAWQDSDGRRVPVTVAFRKASDQEVGFTLGPYVWQIDPSLPTGPSQITHAVNLYSAGGVGAPWQATSYSVPGGH